MTLESEARIEAERALDEEERSGRKPKKSLPQGSRSTTIGSSTWCEASGYFYC